MAKKRTRARVARKYIDGDLVPSRCKCGSTLRTKYFKKQIHKLPANWINNGLPCTHVVYRYTRCKCGLWRRDRSFENRI